MSQSPLTTRDKEETLQLLVRAFPIVRGQEDQVDRFARDLQTTRAADLADFHRRMEVARETWHLQGTPPWSAGDRRDAGLPGLRLSRHMARYGDAGAAADLRRRYLDVTVPPPRPCAAVAAHNWGPSGAMGVRVGRVGLLATGGGLLLAGLVISYVGVTDVFVNEDRAFMGVTRAALDAVNQRLVPLIAHDRAGFGGHTVCVQHRPGDDRELVQTRNAVRRGVC